MSSPDIFETTAESGKALLEIVHEGPRSSIASEVPPVALRLLPRSASTFMTLPRALIAVLFFTTLFAASNMWTKAEARRNRMVIAPPAVVDTTSVLDDRAGGLHASQNDWADPRVDLNGNEIDDAVGDYRVDRRGEMYERHAPDTALLHLSAPKI